MVVSFREATGNGADFGTGIVGSTLGVRPIQHDTEFMFLALTPAASMPSSHGMSAKRIDALHRAQLYAAICFLWLVLFAWFAFSTGPIEDLVLAVCTFFALVALGLPALMGFISSQNDRKRRRESYSKQADDRIETRTGPLRIRQVVVQILLAPAALAVGFTAIAIVDVLVRHSA